ncbi:hypothetical protein PsYK624_060140 [Phanerochaete sordida]|uniref:BTB domain-containing protein n=1 Tax=Phanerochaete sordida TaxID=48140 RepID=A0A9P3G618_9APHY|nr:hypothetical protein PsYK624_060140 [Phanerochaete sordida]
MSTRVRSPSLEIIDAAEAPTKRRKVEPDGDDSALQRMAPAESGLGARSDDLWLDDGNMILQAKGMSLRVHRSVLTLRSEVFKALLNPTAVAQLETFEGCPVLPVEDHGDDLHDILHIVYYGSNSHWMNAERTPIPYADFRRVVYIAIKYQIKEVMDEARHRLSQVFPTDALSSWTISDTAHSAQLPVDVTYPDCIDVLHLARLLHMPHIVPLVLYVCCIMDDPDLLVDGVAYAGGAERAALAREDLRACLRGRAALVGEAAQTMRAFQALAAGTAPLPAQCTTRARCRQALLLLGLAAVDDRLYSDPSAIDSMDVWLETKEAQPNARPCKHCGSHLREVINKRREETWCKLGEIFGVQEWPAVKQLQQGDETIVIA